MNIRTLYSLLGCVAKHTPGDGICQRTISYLILTTLSQNNEFWAYSDQLLEYIYLQWQSYHTTQPSEEHFCSHFATHSPH
jgi:hypothetical protein